MTFKEMCAACPSNTNFAINNIPADNYEFVLDVLIGIQREVGAKRPPPFALVGFSVKKKLSLRFYNNGDFAGWLSDDSYQTTQHALVRNKVKGGNYEFTDLDFFSPATLDVMSVL